MTTTSSSNFGPGSILNSFGEVARVANHLVDAFAAIILVCEVTVLLAGVISRYVFQHSLIWSDELASILFLWLAMIGSVIALRREEHMRLTIVLAKVAPTTRLRLESISMWVVTIFLMLMLAYSYEYTIDQMIVVTPALGLPDSVRTAALPAGALLMLIGEVARLYKLGWRAMMFGAIALLAVALLLLTALPLLSNIGNGQLVVFFVFLLGTAILISAPIGFAFGLATFAYLTFVTRFPLSIVASRMDEGMSSLVLLAIPLFIFLGALIDLTGMARAMIGFLSSLIGHVRGGLSYVLIGAMYLISGISGSKAADMAAIVPVLFPEMRRRGMSESRMVSLLAANGALTETIPPSLVLITIGSVTGVSMAALFAGGLLPALVLALILGSVAWWYSGDDDARHVQPATRKEIATASLWAAPALLLPFVIRFAVVEGIATATEVSTVGVAYTLIVGAVVYRDCEWRRLYPALIDTASLSGCIMLIIGTATSMAWALTQSGFSHQLVLVMVEMPGGAIGFMAISILVFIVLGSLLEGIPAIVLLGPLLFPLAQEVGINEIQYAMVAILAMGIGLFAPPFGVGYYYTCAIGRTSPDAAMYHIWPYLGAVFAGLVLVALFPWISTCFT